MGAFRLDIPAGKQFGRLTVLREGPVLVRPGLKRRTLICSCSCGTAETQVRVDTLTRGRTKSCGCLRREAGKKAAAAAMDHGIRNQPLYQVWLGMRHKTVDPRSTDYQAGICDSWMNHPDVFIRDVVAGIGPRPDGAVLARVDEELPFGPGNVRWIPLAESWRRRRLVSRQRNRIAELERENRRLERLAETLKGEIEMYRMVYGKD